MSKQLTATELVEVANALGMTEESPLIVSLHGAIAALADEIATKLGVRHNRTLYEHDEYGYTSSFYPLTEDQGIPDELLDYDPGADWEVLEDV